MDEKIKEKYKIKIIKDKRYYEYDMTESVPSLEETVPFAFLYKHIELISSSWNKMTLKILEAIDSINPKSEDELLNIHYEWTKTDIFSKTKKTNYAPFKNIFLNVNHTATHAMMNIQGLLKEYGIPLSECDFLIRRHFVVEPIEVREVIKRETINEFSEMLKNKMFNDAKVNKIVLCFNNTINRILSKVSSGYDDFFLFDDYYYFANYKPKVLEYLSTNVAGYMLNHTKNDLDKKISIIKRYLEYLDEYYKKKKAHEIILAKMY